MAKLSIQLLLILGVCTNAFPGNPVELGKVNWLRNLEEARAAASIKGKPILILFQEIPGCLTCKQYGKAVLSHPLIVETIETYFVPLAIYNNRKGPDESVLAFYQEPSWNNPVVRIVGENKKDILPRLNGQYTPSALVGYMIEGLKKTGNEIPPYLSLLHDDLQAEEKGKEKVTLSMYCFWTGERALGSLDGVVETEAGFMDGHEVVNVYYDPQKISLQSVIKRGKASRCADAVYLNEKGDKQGIASFFKPDQIRKEETFRLDREPKYYMGKTLFALLPMTTVQSVKINALLGSGKTALHLLSPRQMAMYEYLEKHSKPSWRSSINDDGWQEKMFAAWESLGLREKS